MTILWLEFIGLAAIVIISGSRLSRYADVMAEKTGLGRTWIGVVILASFTSAPELLTGISSVTIAGAPDIAVADVLGSCLFNLTIIAILDLLYRPGAILSKAEQGHILAAGFGLVAMAVVAIGLFYSQQGYSFNVLWIGWYTPVLVFLYFAGMRVIYGYEKRKMKKDVKEYRQYEQYEKISLGRARINLGMHGAIVIIAATFLPFVGKNLAETSGLGQTFIGLLFVALATSLPEVATSIAAMRIGAIDLAVAGLLGSNLFNINILAIDDLLDTNRPILADVSTSQLLPAMSAILIGGIAILTLFQQSETRRFLRLTWLAAVIFIIYFLTSVGVFVLETR